MSRHLPAWAVVSPHRAGHIARVAALLDQWAVARGAGTAERARYQRAAWLHDALKDAPAETLAAYVPEGRWPAKVWHGPAAAVAARRHGETDQGVLDAIAYHSLGFAGWDDAGKLLYLADWLEPGREEHGPREAALAARVPGELEQVLREVAAERIARLRQAGKDPGPETEAFWTRLNAGA